MRSSLRPASLRKQRPFLFERLEHRSLLAGNVLVAVNAGELDITGDNAANSIQVGQVSPGTWKVTGIATKLNGGNAPVTESGVSTIDIQLSGGNDTCIVTGGTLTGGLFIMADDNPSTPPDGNNVVQVSNVTAGAVHVFVANGNNTISISNVSVQFSALVLAGNGNNTISLSHVTGGTTSGENQCGVFTGFGKDVISFSNVSLAAGTGSNGVNTAAKTAVISMSNVNLTLHDGFNGVLADGSSVNVSMSNVTLNTFKGDNLVSALNGSGAYILSHVTMNIDVGNNVVENNQGAITLLNCSLSATEVGGNEIQETSGHNSVIIANSTFSSMSGDGNSIELGGGTTTLAITNSQFTGSASISTGAGNDVIALTKVSVADGDLSIGSGDGTDAIALNSVNVGPNNLSVDVGSGNYDVLSVVNFTAGTEDFSDTGGTNGTIVGAKNHFAAAPVVNNFRWQSGI